MLTKAIYNKFARTANEACQNVDIILPNFLFNTNQGINILIDEKVTQAIIWNWNGWKQSIKMVKH